ncbi:MAG: choice-of-anchor I family protein [Flavobacterium sp.]|nr:choice-of-anchor I family protein [Pedobacter sp.]
MNKKLLAAIMFCAFAFGACQKESNNPDEEQILETPGSFQETAMITLGGETAAEISTYDPISKRLFVVNNEGGVKVDVIDLSKYPIVTKLQTLNYSAVSSGVNSVAVYNGILAIAVNGLDKQDNGKVIILNATTFKQVCLVTVGAMPDMVIFSPDGKYIVTADEGEPSADYVNDPLGTISIIDTENKYAVKTLNFAGFEGGKAALFAAGFRVFGLNASFSKDIEPEYITIRDDSRKAWVTLQENNGIAEVDLVSGTIIRIMPLGTKDISKPQSAFDVSDKDGKIELKTWPVQSFYLPDAISHFVSNGKSYLALANEGDTRDYDAFAEEIRVKDMILDPTRFGDAASLQLEANLGRLIVTNTQGDTDGDGDIDVIYGFGGRSVTILDAVTGSLVAEIGKDLEERVISAGKYDDGRSDNKGVEVESVIVAKVNGANTAFIGMERADMIAVYDVSNPAKPKFLQLLNTGDAPEGLLFIKATDSPNGRNMLVVSCEGDGTVHFYQSE